MKSKSVSSIHSSKLFFFALSAILVFLGWKFIGITFQNIESQSDISTLRTQLEEMQSRQENLKRMENFFKSDFFAEREARMKFGLQKKEERMVILKEEPLSLSQEKNNVDFDKSGNEENKTNSPRTTSSRSRWWDYFFGN